MIIVLKWTALPASINLIPAGVGTGGSFLESLERIIKAVMKTAIAIRLPAKRVNTASIIP